MIRSRWILAGLVLCCRATHADTFVSGAISTNTTWTLAGSPYIVTGEVGVFGGGSPVLTIQPGVTVKFNSGVRLYTGVYGPGGIQAVGTSTQPITFTANTGSPSAGFWRGIHLLSQTLSSSRIEWATVKYAGGGGIGGLYVESCSPTIVNVTAENNLHSGISVFNASPAISSATARNNPWGIHFQGTGSPSVTGSTVTSNTSGGIWAATPSNPTLQTVTISNNTGYAVSQDAAVTLGTVTALTATGNTNNAVEVRTSVTGVNTTWKSFGLPYVVTGEVAAFGAGSPVLTIQAGVTVKFNAGVRLYTGLYGPGGIQAVGTSAQPIIFTANSGTPSAGFWRGIHLLSQTLSSSRVAWATVEYAGQAGSSGGIHFDAASGTVERTTARNNLQAGVSIGGSGSVPVIRNCTFAGNTTGVHNFTPAQIFTANLNYWSSSDGPSGAGSGTGQAVSTGVVFEPWLTAAPSATQYFSTAKNTNRTFNPAIAINTKLEFTSQLSGNWTITISTLAGGVLRTYTGSGTSGLTLWDGKNGAGVDQADGAYAYQLQTQTGGGQTATPAKGRTVIDRTKQLTLTGVTVSELFFSPNADTVKDTTTIGGTASFEATNFTLSIKNSGGATVRSSTSVTQVFSYTWDGKNGSGVVQPDGPYTLELAVSNGTATASAAPTSTLDKTLPTASITSPTSGQLLSNVYQSGSADVAVVGTIGDTNLLNWSLDGITTGTTPVTNTTIGTWATLVLGNGGPYTLRLRVWDKAGNYREVSQNHTIGNFKVAQSAVQINAAAGNTVTYTSTVPFTLTETLFVKNAAGQTVRTLYSGSRAAGTYMDVWNGRNASSALLPDGPYFYFATVTAGSSSMTWDLSTQFLNDYVGHGYTATAGDPFNNTPISISYNFQAGRVSIAASPNSGISIPAGCPPPAFCIINGRYEEAGPHTVQWAGTDPTGRYRADVKIMAVISERTQFPKNAIVVFGTVPIVTNVRTVPAMYAPTNGSQAITFTLSTYQNQTANVTITILNQQSLSVLRTFTLPNQAPGTVGTTWDGRAADGIWVAPGAYTVTATATDSLGNQASGAIVTTIHY